MSANRRSVKSVAQHLGLRLPALSVSRCRVDEPILITCPYCGEDVEIYLEPETRGTLVQDCEVCCNPWQLRVTVDGDERYVDVSRADGSE
jgi:hypothetical protein